MIHPAHREERLWETIYCSMKAILSVCIERGRSIDWIQLRRQQKYLGLFHYIPLRGSPTPSDVMNRKYLKPKLQGTTMHRIFFSPAKQCSANFRDFKATLANNCMLCSQDVDYQSMQFFIVYQGECLRMPPPSNKVRIIVQGKPQTK